MKKIFVILAAAIFTLSSCDKEGYVSIGEGELPPYEENYGFLLLRNYSSEDTVWFIPDKEHADALPENELSEWQKISIFHIGAHSSMELSYDSSDNYTTPLETYGVEDRMTFYVFKKSVWSSHSWSELVSGQLWACKYSLSVEEALAQNRTVTYPMR